MSKFFRSRIFIFGFFVGFIIFFLITDYVDKKDRGICFDCEEKFGFPFYFLETGGQAFSERYILSGLIGNILFALICSFILGLIFKFVWQKSQREN